MSTEGTYMFPSQVVLNDALRAECLKSSALRPLLDLASDTLGTDLLGALRDGTPEDVNDPCVRRPIITMMGIAGYREEQRLRPFRPACVTGISLGALTAAAAVGWASLEDMVRMSYLMARIETEEFKSSDYRSVFFYNCGHEAAFKALREDGAADLLHLSVIISPNQFLAGCRLSDLPLVTPSLVRAGALLQVIPHSYPGHCDLMARVQQRFADEWQFSDPCKDLSVPLVSIIDGRPCQSAESVWTLAVQQYSTIMDWRAVLRYLEDLQLQQYVVLRPAEFVMKSMSLDATCGIQARMGGIGSAG